MGVNISVITPTWCRPKHLLSCLTNFKGQNLKGLKAEHIVVSDGPDSWARALATGMDAKYFELPEHMGHTGAFARDMGMQNAQGEYLCFWDDDNSFYNHALRTAHKAASGKDIGIVQMSQWVGNCKHTKVPDNFVGAIRHSQIDSMNLCVRREVAMRKPWGSGRKASVDFHWIKSIFETKPTWNFARVVVGEHIGRRTEGKAIKAAKGTV